MSKERQETVADNVSMNHQFREVAKMIPHEEMDVSKMETTTPTGNAAEMREALSDACYAMFNFLKTQNSGFEEMAKALDKAKAALAKPPRNCDVGTAEEQARRYEDLCNSHTCGSICSGSGCPLYAYDCSPFSWSQMPYEGGCAE